MKSKAIEKESEIDIQEIFFPSPHFLRKDELSSLSPSTEKVKRIHRIHTLALPILRQDYF